MDEKIEKCTICDYKRYYAIRDKVANDVSSLWSAKNNADALRCFNNTIAKQLQSGVIVSENDYELWFICKVITYDDGNVYVKGIPYIVQDNEVNNTEVDNV